MGMVPQGYRVNHFLTDTDAFFIMTDAPNGLKHFVRSPIKTAIEHVRLLIDQNEGKIEIPLKK